MCSENKPWLQNLGHVLEIGILFVLRWQREIKTKEQPAFVTSALSLEWEKLNSYLQVLSCSTSS
jgi:hypothetical protein